MDIGTGLTILGICGVLVASIIRFVPSKNKMSNSHFGKKDNPHVSFDTFKLFRENTERELGEIKIDIRDIRQELRDKK